MVLAVILGVALSVALSARQPKQYQASAALLFQDSTNLVQILTGVAPPQADPSTAADTNLRLVSLANVAQAAATSLSGGETEADVARHVSVAQQGQSGLVLVTATEPQAANAARVANAFASAFVSLRRQAAVSAVAGGIAQLQQQLKPRLAPSTRAELRSDLDRLRLVSGLQSGGVQLAQSAQLPSSPSSPTTKRNGVIGGFAGLLLGLALAIALEGLDKKVRRPKDAEALFGLPLLATVHRSKPLARWHRSGKALGPVDAEAFHRLRANLRHGSQQSAHSVLVTSALPASGKTTVAVHLAESVALAGARTLLIEADTRAPRLARLLEVTPDQGLNAALSSPRDVVLSNFVTQVPAQSSDARTDVEFDALLADPEAPAQPDLLDSSRMRGLLQTAHESYDFIVIDAPPAGVVADAVPLLHQVEGVIIVTRLGRETRGGIERLRGEMEKLNVIPRGIVANFARGEPSDGVKDYVVGTR